MPNTLCGGPPRPALPFTETTGNQDRAIFSANFGPEKMSASPRRAVFEYELRVRLPTGGTLRHKTGFRDSELFKASVSEQDDARSMG